MAGPITILSGPLPDDLCECCRERLEELVGINREREVIVELAFPIQAHGEEVRELTVRRVKAGDLKATRDIRDEEERSLALIRRLCGIPDSSVDKLDQVDLVNLGRAIEGFGERGPRTGRTR